MRTEPARIVSIVTAVLTLLIAFGWTLSQEQSDAIIGFAIVVAPLIVAAGEIIRRRVWSQASVDELVEEIEAAP